MQNISNPIPIIKAFFFDAQNIAAGLIGSIIGYFIPVRDVVHLMLFMFFVDVFFGYLVDRKYNNARFKVKLVWNYTFPRMVISILLVMLTFMWDSVGHQEMVSTSNIVGWFISGVLIFSVAENGFLLTEWGIFLKIRNLITKKVGDETGTDITEDVKTKEEIKQILKNKTHGNKPKRDKIN